MVVNPEIVLFPWYPAPQQNVAAPNQYQFLLQVIIIGCKIVILASFFIIICLQIIGCKVLTLTQFSFRPTFVYHHVRNCKLVHDPVIGFILGDMMLCLRNLPPLYCNYSLELLSSLGFFLVTFRFIFGLPSQVFLILKSHRILHVPTPPSLSCPELCSYHFSEVYHCFNLDMSVFVVYLC